MTTDQTPEPLRIPIAHSVLYAVRGLAPIPNLYGAHELVPGEITLTYRASEDSQLGRIHAYVAGHLVADGVELPTPNGLYGQHYDNGLEGWPAWLAEEARLHDPAAVPVPPPADQTAEVPCVCGEPSASDTVHRTDGPCYVDNRMRMIATALARVDARTWATGERLEDQPLWQVYLRYARAVLAVLPEQTDRAAVLSLTAVERQFLTFALDLASDKMASRGDEFSDEDWAALETLRRVAAEEQPTETQGTTADKAAALGLTDGEYRARSHAAAVATVRAAIPGMYAHVGFRLEDVLNEADEAQQPETQEALRCVCGDPVQLMDEADPTSWIHSPGSDTRCLDARPRCPHCQMPHDLTPSMALACASIRASVRDRDAAEAPE